MMYQYGQNYINLSHIYWIRRLKGTLRYDYLFFEKTKEGKKRFFGLFKDPDRPAGYYVRDWFDGQLHPTTKERAEYGNSVRIWLTGEEMGTELNFSSEKEMEDFIRKCEKAMDIRCKL